MPKEKLYVSQAIIQQLNPYFHCTRIKKMTLLELIEKFKEQAGICAITDYSDKKMVKGHNLAVKKMYQIVKEINDKFGSEGLEAFSKFLDIEEGKIKLWAAVKLLEATKVEGIIKDKALAIIKNIAKGDDVEALGFQLWLKDFTNSN